MSNPLYGTRKPRKISTQKTSLEKNTSNVNLHENSQGPTSANAVSSSSLSSANASKTNAPAKRRSFLAPLLSLVVLGLAFLMRSLVMNIEPKQGTEAVFNLMNSVSIGLVWIATLAFFASMALLALRR